MILSQTPLQRNAKRIEKGKTNHKAVRPTKTKLQVLKEKQEIGRVKLNLQFLIDCKQTSDIGRPIVIGDKPTLNSYHNYLLSSILPFCEIFVIVNTVAYLNIITLC